MRAVVALLPAAALCQPADPDVGFADWFTTSLQEADDIELHVDGAIPPYVHGVLAQSGPGRFEIGDERFTHAFDGFGKVNRYVFNASGGTVKVRYSSSFVRSKFYADSLKKGKIAASLLAAETAPPSRAKLGPLNLKGANDNNYIKPREVVGRQCMASDTQILLVMEGGWRDITRTEAPFGFTLLEQTPREQWKGKLDIPAMDDHICMTANFAHGNQRPNGDYLVTAACNAMVPGAYRDYHVLYKIAKDDKHNKDGPHMRDAVATIKMPKGRLASYMHMNAITENYYVMISVPLHLDMPKLMAGRGLAEGALQLPANESTVFHIIDLRDGSVRDVEAPGFQMGHVANAYEDGGDIVFDLTEYKGDLGGFFPRFLLSNMLNKTRRDALDLGEVVRYRLKADWANGTVERSLTMPDEPGANMDVPVVNPNYETKKYCVFWALQFTSGSPVFAHIAYVKRNICTGEKVTKLRKNMYPSEHQFVPRPGATEEDDGVLLGVVYDGERKETILEVLDGKTLSMVASAPLGMHVPFPVHASWYPDLSAWSA